MYASDEYGLLTDAREPKCYDEVYDYDHKNEWVKAMQEEINSLNENHTYDLVKL